MDKHRCCQNNNNGEERATHFLCEVMWNLLRGFSKDIFEDGRILYDDDQLLYPALMTILIGLTEFLLLIDLAELLLLFDSGNVAEPEPMGHTEPMSRLSCAATPHAYSCELPGIPIPYHDIHDSWMVLANMVHSQSS
jgi:hypothetical protein